MIDSLSAATCAIYVILAFPILYLLFKHGRNGFLGWLYLFVFCSLRIISGGLGVKKSDGAVASIISNIGLSPLLLATAGILHEAFVTHYPPSLMSTHLTKNSRAYRIFGIDKKLEWAQALFFHTLVGAGVALAAAGSAKLQNHDQPIDKAEKMIKVGIVILAVSWGILVGWTGLSFRAPKGDGPVVRAGTTVRSPFLSFSRFEGRLLNDKIDARLHRLLPRPNRRPRFLQSRRDLYAGGVS